MLASVTHKNTRCAPLADLNVTGNGEGKMYLENIKTVC